MASRRQKKQNKRDRRRQQREESRARKQQSRQRRDLTFDQFLAADAANEPVKTTKEAKPAPKNGGVKQHTRSWWDDNYGEGKQNKMLADLNNILTKDNDNAAPQS